MSISNSPGLRWFAVFASLAAAAGCGGSSPVVPHQTGSYSNASFKGSYVFQMRGFIQDPSTGALDPYREVGVITSDGNGNITAGADNAAAAGAAPQVSRSVTGSYTIDQDGTGQISLNSTAFGALFSSPITLAVILSSPSNAVLLEADVFADGAGTAELQDPSAIGAIPSGTFAFRIHQESFTGTGASASQVGVFTVSGGHITGGSMDQNLFPGGSALLNVTGGGLALSSLGNGSGTIADSSGNTAAISYYIVNRSRFAFLVTNSGAVGSGSAEAQSGAVGGGLSGTYAFGSRGDDSSGNANVATVGQFTAGAGSFSGALDAMQDGNYSGLVKVTGTPGATSAAGRTQISVSGGPTMIFWMVSPSRAFFLDENESAAEDGTADLQTASSFSAGTLKGQYALVMDGIDLTPEAVGRIGTLQFDGSSKITLVELANDSSSGAGAQSPGTLGGTYQVGGSGRITTEITSNNGSGPDLVLYAVSPGQAYALQIDGGANTSGTISLQQ